MPISPTVAAGLIGVGGGLANTAIQRVFDKNDKESEKQWWYEQQKFLEDHNSPAYRAMQLRQAGLNPYSEVSSVPLGNVDSSLPRTNTPKSFDVNAIQNSLLIDAQRENIEQDTETKASVAGLNQEKTKTETEWRSNIIQQTLNLQQEYELGLINQDMYTFKFIEYKNALAEGYNSYLIEQDLKESNILLNESLISLNEKKGNKIAEETLLTSVSRASASLKLSLDLLYAKMERQAQLKDVELKNAFTDAQLYEFLDTQDVRISLTNVQKAFAKLAVDSATRADALDKITNERDRALAQQMLDAINNGDGLSYWMLNMLQNDPGAFLHSMTNILTSLAPNVNYNHRF